MDKTDCLELPYPQCDPPLVKDASDIVHFKALAEAVDSAVQTLDDRLDDRLLTIDAVNMTGTTAATNNSYVTHYFTATSINNGGLYDADKDLAVIQRDGWYAVGGWASASHASLPTSCVLQIQPIVNGMTITSVQGPSSPAVGFDYVAWTDVLFLRAGDEVQCQTNQGLFATPVTYECTMWILSVINNV